MSNQDQKDRLIRAIQQKAQEFIGVNIKVDHTDMIDLMDYNDIRLGNLQNDQALISLTEFTVQKYSVRHGDQQSQRRTMCLTEQCIVERDPGSYIPITSKALCDIYCLVR